MDAPLQYVSMAKAVDYEVEAVEPTGSRLSPYTTSFNVDYQYVNGFSRPVTIVDRNGMRVVIPPSKSPGMGDFMVRVTITMGRDVNVNIDQLLNSTCAATRTLAEVISKGSQTHRNGGPKSEVEFRVGFSDIESRGGSLFLNNLDVVVSVLQGHLVPHHPRSEAGVRNDLVETNPAINNVGSFGYSIQIVDNGSFFGDRFININNLIYKVPTTKNPDMKDGVYLSSSGPIKGDYSLAPPIAKRFTFSEADEALGLYRTVDEAMSLGDVHAAKEKELKELSIHVKNEEQRLKEQKLQREAEFDRRKNELERERAEADAHRKEEEHRISQRHTRLKEEIAELEHQRSMEMIRAKDGYEHRSMQRKESNEIVKYLPAIFTGLLALFVALKKVS